MNRSESKYFHTAVKMDKALLSLLEKKDFAFITIQEICREAGVNRSTFYLHYQNIAELLEESVAYMQHSFYAYFHEAHKNQLLERDLISEEYLVPYLTYIREHQKLFQAAIRQNVLFQTEMQFQTLFETIFNPAMEKRHVPISKRNYLVTFYLHGILAIIEEWLKTDCRDSIETITAIILQCAKTTS